MTTLIVKIKPEYKEASFLTLVSKIPEDKRVTFSLLWNDFLNLDDIVSANPSDIERILKRFKTDLAEYIKRDFFGKDESDSDNLRKILVDTFYKVVKTETRDDNNEFVIKCISE